eukprot:COSAG06_NODE_577_length_14043_cov_5.505952_3_plen_68_part_00
MQAQHAWADCAAAIIAQSLPGMPVTLAEVIGFASLDQLHTARRRAQTLLSQLKRKARRRLFRRRPCC